MRTRRLTIPGRPVTPDVLTPDADGNFFTTFLADDINVTVTNADTVAHDLDLLCEYWHSLEREFGSFATVNLTPTPFVVGSASGLRVHVGDGREHAAADTLATDDERPRREVDIRRATERALE